MITQERRAQMMQNARGIAEGNNLEMVMHKVRERIQDFPNDPQFREWLECLEEAKQEIEAENS